MTIMQQAAIYKLIHKNKFLVHNISKVQMGAGVASEPFVWLEGNAPLTEIVEQLMYVLSKTKTGLPNPTDWKESAKIFLNNIGLKKQSDLYKDSIHVSVLKKDGTLYFTPMKNLGSKGFVNVSEDKVEIAENADKEEIAKALDKALSKCE